MASIVTIPADSDFTLDNLPYGVYATAGSKSGKIGVAIGDQILDLSSIRHLFDGPLMKDHQVHSGFGVMIC
jgi:fumarylacetoacetase